MDEINESTVDAPQQTETTFLKDLEGLINQYSKENDSNTPDFILAEYLGRCLEAYNTAVRLRDTWHD